MTTRVKKPASTALIPRLTVLPALLVMLATLVSAAGCQPNAKPTTEVNREPEEKRGSSTSAAATRPAPPPSGDTPEPTPSFRPSHHRRWTLEQYHLGIAQDRHGLVWFATYAGLTGMMAPTGEKRALVWA